MTLRTSRTRSIYHNRPQPADDFVPWLIKLWDSLTPQQQASANMDVRRVRDDMVMAGISFDGIDGELPRETEGK